MELDLRKVAPWAAAFTAGYVAGCAVATWTEHLMRTIDEAIANLDFDDRDDDECTCSTIGVVSTTAGAVLHNGDFGLLPLAATFIFVQYRPIAAYMTLTLDVELPSGEMVQDEQTWEFARDLIDTAISLDGERAGEGDVQVQVNGTDHNVLTFWLKDIEGIERRVDVDIEPVREWIAETFHVVPAEQESAEVDVDVAIGRLFDGTWQA